MTDKATTKLTIPKIRRDMSNLSELLREAIPVADVQSVVSISEQGSAEPASSAHGDREQVSAPLVQNAASEPVKVAEHVKTTSRAMIKLGIEEELILATKIRALEEKTTAAAIVEAALRSFLKM
jgi:hypothetical protein